MTGPSAEFPAVAAAAACEDSGCGADEAPDGVATSAVADVDDLGEQALVEASTNAVTVTNEAMFFKTKSPNRSIVTY